MKTQKPSRKLNRYTTLPVLLDMLKKKRLILLDPSSWEDKNDAYVILEYKRRKKIPKLFTVCFSIGNETIHHWKTYANGISGCCIQFDEEKLLKTFTGIEQIRYGEVKYKRIKDVGGIELDQIPFVKRYPYRIEREFRILWEGSTKLNSIEIDINLNSIIKITISQNMPEDVYETIVDLLRQEIRNPSQKINRSTIYENKKWIDSFKSTER
jgi:hypothetical protein